MGIFTRFRDIISANINAMLDRAEDPEKLIKLMIREMEDTLVEIKASCAGVMASRRKVERQLEDIDIRSKHWEEKAELAVSKGRDDLAREALMEKRKYTRRQEALVGPLLRRGVPADWTLDAAGRAGGTGGRGFHRGLGPLPGDPLQHLQGRGRSGTRAENPYSRSALALRCGWACTGTGAAGRLRLDPVAQLRLRINVRVLEPNRDASES